MVSALHPSMELSFFLDVTQRWLVGTYTYN